MYLQTSIYPFATEMKVFLPWVDFLVALFPHVFLEHVSALEDFLAENADEVVEPPLQQVEKVAHKDQVVRLTHAEVVAKGHVVEHVTGAVEHGTAKQAAVRRNEKELTENSNTKLEAKPKKSAIVSTSKTQGFGN